MTNKKQYEKITREENWEIVSENHLRMHSWSGKRLHSGSKIEPPSYSCHAIMMLTKNVNMNEKETRGSAHEDQSSKFIKFIV